jgi:hypothetical protein
MPRQQIWREYAAQILQVSYTTSNAFRSGGKVIDRQGLVQCGAKTAQ